MLTEEFKEKLKNHIDNQFSLMIDEDSDTDSVCESVTSDLEDFTKVVDSSDEDEYWEFVDGCLNECVSSYHDSIDEEE